MTVTTGLFLVAAVVLLWFGNMRARERAIELARAACRRDELQFLDDTVVLARWGLRWRPRLRVYRTYHFEYTDIGAARYPGCITLVGDTLEGIDLGVMHS
jgi:hypothetical protein